MTKLQTIYSKIEGVLNISNLALVETSDKEGLKALLTLTSTGKKQYTIQNYADNTNLPRLWVPRGIITNQMWSADMSLRRIGEHSVTGLILRPEQQRLYNTYLTGLKQYPNGGIIKAPTGFGKTVLALKIAYDLGLRTLIIVPTDRIMTQWVEAIKFWLGSEAGIIRQDIYNPARFTVAMIHTLARHWMPSSEFRSYDNFDHIIYDEVHVTGAETFSRTLGLGNPHIRTGLSATPRRKDGMGEMFEWHIGPILATLDTPTSKPKVIATMYHDERTNHSGCVWYGELNLGRYLNRLTKCQPRTQALTALVVKAFSKGHSILVLTDRLNMVEDIRRELRIQGVPSDDIGICTGDCKVLNKRIIVGTYGSAGMGLDIPDLSCLVLATPRTDIEQAVGRVLRLKEGKKMPVVVDIIDSASSIMNGWWFKRRKFYEKYCNEIKVIKVGGSNGKDGKS